MPPAKDHACTYAADWIASQRRLERDGLVLRTVYPTVPVPVDYRLTDAGAGLTHLVKALADWSLAHRAGIAEALRVYDQTYPTMTSAHENGYCPVPVTGTDALSTTS